MGRWAKSHDQRKGQWLFNELEKRHNLGNFIATKEKPCKMDIHRAPNLHLILFNITNENFDEIMESYYN